MSSNSINIPPAALIDQSIVVRRDYEHIILWMLNNNESCEWINFIDEPVGIKKSTLSDKLRSLISKGFVRKEGKNYRITSKGRERYNEISITKEDRIKMLNYPPDVITSVRKYDHWILWMVYNNAHCKWSDFQEKPIFINQSSLSKNLNKLMEDGLIIKVNKEYKITPDGRAQYSKMLREYDLDRQSILEEETSRIDEITEKTSEFFEDFEIENEDLKFRFLNNILKLEYSKAEEFVQEEEFNKIILYLSMNHPDQYPNYISPEEFSLNYGIKRTTLDFFVDKIVEEKFYTIKFFKIIAEDNKTYYFQANGELEKILSAIVEKHITKFTYLNKFHSTSENGNKPIEIELILNQILERVLGFLFNEKLKSSLKKFLPEYINYLAYKIESTKTLIRSEDKLEAAQWQTFQNVFQSYEPILVSNGNGNGEYYYTLPKVIWEALDITYLSELDFVSDNSFEKEYFGEENLENVRKFIRLLKRNKFDKANGIFDIKTNNENLTDTEKLIIDNLLMSSRKDLDGSKEASERLLSEMPESYVGYLFNSLALSRLNSLESALDVIEKGISKSEHYSLFCVKAQIQIRLTKPKEAMKTIENALVKKPKNIHLLKTKFLILLRDQSCWAECAEQPLDIIEDLINMKPDELSFYVLKAAILCVLQKYKEAKKFINKEINLSIVTKNPRIHTSAFFLLTYSYVARGKFEKALNFSDQTIFQYGDHPISYFTKAVVIGYGLIYKIERKEITEEKFLEMIEKTITLDPIKSNQAKYHYVKGDVFSETRGFEDAIEEIDTAISLDPSNGGIYEVKMKLLMKNNKSDEAIALVSQLHEDNFIDQKELYYLRSFLYFVKADNTKDPDERKKLINKSFSEIQPIIEDNQKDTMVLNNLAVLYGHLGRKDDAIKTAEKMVGLNPSDGNLYDSYGEILMLFSEYEEALKKFERAIKLEPKGWFIFQTYLKMGACYESLMDFEKAEENYLKGKEFTKRIHPLKRDMYFYKANEKLEELKKAREELANKKV